MIPLLKYTDLGLYAVAGTSAILLVIKDLLFKIPYIAKIVKVNPWNFWTYVIKYAICAGFIILISISVKSIIPATNWFLLIVDAVIVGLFSCIINYIIIFNKNDKKSVKAKMSHIVKKKDR